MTFNCPECSEPMQNGTASVHGTFEGVIVARLSYQHLFFNPDTKSKNVDTGFIDKAIKFVRGDPEVRKKAIIKSGESRNAYQCTKCNLVLIKKTYL